MKKLKKQYILTMSVCILLAAGLLTACTGKSHDAQQNVNEPETELSEDRTDVERDVAEVDMEQEWKDMPVPQEDDKIAELRSLSSEELSELTEFVTEADGYGNYGFLLSVYDSPEKIDLDEVFYTGAGIKTEPLSSEEEKAFLNAVGDEEIYTDVVKLTTSQINDVLLRRTGLSYEQMANPLQWIYRSTMPIIMKREIPIMRPIYVSTEPQWMKSALRFILNGMIA